MTDNELRKDVLYIRNNIPTLYKYLDYEGSIAMLVKSQLLFRNPSSFNDPYDCYAGLIDFRETKYYRQYLTPIISKYPEGLNELFLETLGKETDDETSMIFAKILLSKEFSIIGITCFSEEFNNLLMWSHYSKSHKGVCVGFDLDHLLVSLKGKKPSLIKVKYTDKIKKMYYYVGKQDALFNCFRTKSIHWAYEKEIRIAIYYLTFNNNKQSFIPFGREAIAEIYLGSMMEQKEVQKILSISKDKYPEAKIYKMELNEESFNLIPQEIKYQ